MGVLFNKVDKKDLRVGDHIYSWRTGYTYSHHGIFVGDNDVIHFTRGSGQELEAGGSLINSIASSSIPKQHLTCPRFPDSCSFENGNNGVIRSCLDCFLEGGPVCRFEYGVCIAVFFAQVRGGTCTLAKSDGPETVIHRAMCLLQSGFGKYDVVSNNCEDFAIYCKTGFLVNRNASARSGQVAALDGVLSGYSFAYCSRVILSNSQLGLAVLVGTYLFKRYSADIGVCVDKIKVPVEDLAAYLHFLAGIRVDETKLPVEDSADLDSSTSIRVGKTKEPVEDVSVFLHSSTCKKPPVEDLAVYLDSSTRILVDKTKEPVDDVAVFLHSSTCKKPPVEDLAVCLGPSTGIRVDKTQAPVEDVAAFLDSSTGKKPPLAESSTSQAISRNGSSKKQKKKFRQQHRKNCQSAQELEDVAVFPDSSTGKKPSVAESSTPQTISRNNCSKKQKKKPPQQQRRNGELVKAPIPSGPVLHGN